MTEGRRFAVAGVALLLCLSMRAPAGADTGVQALIDAAFAAIDGGDAQKDPARQRAAYETAAARAEEAVRVDDASADAHYALFCALGRLTELRGPLGQALMVRRLRREVERALQLNPQHSEALAAKAEMLLRLPRLLGGDVREAETYVRRSLVYDPTYWRAYLLLARVLVSQSRPEAAREALQGMLEHIDPQRHERAEALALLAELGPTPRQPRNTGTSGS